MGAAAIGGPDAPPGALGPGVSTVSGRMKFDCENFAMASFWAWYWSMGTAGKNGMIPAAVLADGPLAAALGS